MAEELGATANEGGSFTVTLSGFTDAIGVAVMPVTLTWTLSTKHGEVINEREGVEATPDEEVVILLSGDDLALLPNESGLRNEIPRVLTVIGTYNSSLGIGVPMTAEYWFGIKPLVGIG